MAERQKSRRGGDRALSKRDYELLAEFRHLIRRFLAFSEAAAGRCGLTPQQHQALLAIKGFPESGSLTVGDLAARLDIRPHSAVGLVDRLEARNLVRRRANPADRRQVLIALTPAAEAVLEQLSLAHREELQHLAPNLGALLSQLRRASGGGRGASGTASRR